MGELERRKVIKSMLAVAASLPFVAPTRALAQAKPYEVPGHLIHPELRALVGQMRAYAAAMPKLSKETLKATREFKFPSAPTAPSDVSVEKRRIGGTAGQPEVAIFIINAKAGTSRPAILHTHGGGFVSGSAEQSVTSLQELCKALDCVAVSVDYRLAPEATYRGSIEDNYAGLKWLHANAAALGADPARIAVMGESAGGGHAALLALTARDRGEVPVCFQCLIYPMLDDRTGSSVTKPPHMGAIGWSAPDNHFGWESFLGQRPGGRGVPVAAVPARRTDLAGLPPAFIGVGSLDLFYDEDVDYAQRLNAAGVSTELIAVQGAFHGFDFLAKMMNLPLGFWFEQTKLNALRRGFGLAAI